MKQSHVAASHARALRRTVNGNDKGQMGKPSFIVQGYRTGMRVFINKCFRVFRVEHLASGIGLFLGQGRFEQLASGIVPMFGSNIHFQIVTIVGFQVVIGRSPMQMINAIGQNEMGFWPGARAEMTVPEYNGGKERAPMVVGIETTKQTEKHKNNILSLSLIRTCTS